MREHQRFSREHVFAHQSVFSLLYARYLKTPDRQFVTSLFRDAEEQWSYRESVQQVARVRAFLQARGLRKGDTVNLVIQNSADFLAVYFAALSLGVIVAPINYNFSPGEMSYIIKDSRGRLLFVEEEYLSHVDEIRPAIDARCEVVVLSKGPVPGGHLRFHDILKCHDSAAADLGALGADLDLVGVEDQAVIIYTSGTSGDPKGAILTHANLLADAQAIAEWFGFDCETRTLCILPLFHNNGQVVTLLAPLWVGGSTVMIKGEISLKIFWDLVARYETNWTSVIPTILSVLLAFRIKRTDHTLKGIICGGALLPKRVQLEFEETFRVPIYEGYGLTETTSFSCFNPRAIQDRVIGSIGTPLPVNDMAILDDEGRALGSNETGEICIRGVNVLPEYCGLPELNARAFRGGWFHSGDFGYRDEAGFYYFQGRRDDLIIKGGENIYPREVENVLYGHPRIKDCAVIGIEHRLWGETLAVFVETNDRQEMTSAEVVGYLKGKIADFKIPSECYFVHQCPDLAEIPKGPTRKILRKELKKYYEARLQNGSGPQA